MDTTALPQTKTERDAFVAKMFAGVKPAEQKATSLLELLKPLRPQLRAKRKEGYSLRQIAERLKASPLACDVSPSTVKAVLGGAAAKRKAKMKKLAAQRATNLATAKPVAPAPAVPAATPVVSTKR